MHACKTPRTRADFVERDRWQGTRQRNAAYCVRVVMYWAANNLQTTEDTANAGESR